MPMPMIGLTMVIAAAAGAGSTTDPGILKPLAEYQRHDVRVTTLCIEGQIVVVAHSDVGKGGGLQMLQLQHEVDGKIVPMQCSEKQAEALPKASGASSKQVRPGKAGRTGMPVAGATPGFRSIDASPPRELRAADPDYE